MLNLIITIFEKILDWLSWFFWKIIDGIGWGITRFVGKLTMWVLAIIIAWYIWSKVI